MRRRVLVTGSREWTDYAAVVKAITGQLRIYIEESTGLGSNYVIRNPMIVVDGKCPTGLDEMAHGVVRHMNGLAVSERYPADWERPCDSGCFHQPRFKNGKPYCPMAGHLRNQKMVDLGAHVCLAFPLPDSRGTKDCMKRAKAAGIPVIDVAASND